MEDRDNNSLTRRLQLAPGEQAVINGALVALADGGTLEVGQGAFVLTGRSIWRERDAFRNPREELYFSMLEAGADPYKFGEARFRLFRLLSEVVAQDRTYQAQRECAFCAAAMLSENIQDAIASAARLASDRLDGPRTRDTSETGDTGRRSKQSDLRAQP